MNACLEIHAVAFERKADAEPSNADILLARLEGVRRYGDGWRAFRPPAAAYGITSALEFAIEFYRWAEQQHALTADVICSRWSVSRATGYRWLGVYRAVREREAARA